MDRVGPGPTRTEDSERGRFYAENLQLENIRGNGLSILDNQAEVTLVGTNISNLSVEGDQGQRPVVGSEACCSFAPFRYSDHRHRRGCHGGSRCDDGRRLDLIRSVDDSPVVQVSARDERTVNLSDLLQPGPAMALNGVFEIDTLH